MPPEAGNNRMVRRRQRTRQQIMDAVQSLLLEQGYDDTSAEGIAELADLGRSTFYNHFTNKQEAILATVTEHYRDYGERAYVPLDEQRDRAISITRSTSEVFTAMANDPLTRQLVDRPRVLAQAIAASQAELLVRDLEEGMNQGRFKLVISMENLANTMMWAYVGMLIKAINEDDIGSTCDDWCRLVLLNLGIDAEEIDSILVAAKEA